MVGALFAAGVFGTVVAAYLFTEYVMVRLDARRRVMVGEDWALLLILGVNFASFLVIWLSWMVFVFASGTGHYDYATIICLCAQGVWLTQHLWFYYRDHLRLRYE